MRLLLAIPTLASGGSERIMSLLAAHWSARGDDVSLVTFDPPETDFFRVPAARRFVLGESGSSPARWLRQNVARVRTLREAIHETRPDAIVSFLYTMNLFVLLAARGTAPVIVSERTDPRYSHVEPWQAGLRRILYPFAAALVVQTERVLEGWAHRVVPRAKAFAVPNPVAPPEGGEWTGPALPDRFIASIGRLGPEKGFDILIDAFARAAQDLAGWSLVILGDGPVRAELEAQVERLGLRDRVLLPGLGDADAFLASAQAFAAASRFEGFPNGLLEAMAHGLPAVATDCPSGPAEIIRDGVDGFLVPPESPEELASKLREVCCDEALRRRVGQKAREVVERFSIEHVAARWDEVFRAVA